MQTDTDTHIHTYREWKKERETDMFVCCILVWLFASSIEKGIQCCTKIFTNHLLAVQHIINWITIYLTTTPHSLTHSPTSSTDHTTSWAELLLMRLKERQVVYKELLRSSVTQLIKLVSFSLSSTTNNSNHSITSLIIVTTTTTTTIIVILVVLLLTLLAVIHQHQHHHR